MKGGRSWYATFGIWWAHFLEDVYKDVSSRQSAKLEPPEKGDFISAAVRWWLRDDMDHFALVAPKQYQAFSMGYVGVSVSKARAMKMPVGVVNIAVQYHDYFTRMHDFDNWKIIATETTFGLNSDVVIGENDKVVVYYQGRPDIVGYDVGKGLLEPGDHKTTSSVTGDWESDWATNSQLKGYVVAVRELAKQLRSSGRCPWLPVETEIKSCLINGAARDEPTKKPKDGIVKPRFNRVRQKFSEELLTEWRRDVVEKAARLRYCIENNVWTWKNSACNYQFGHPCEYRTPDSMSPSDRPALFQSHYTTVEPWTPEIVGERKEV